MNKILITGAAKRIGRYLATEFSKTAEKIVLHYNSSEQEVLSLKAEIEKNGCEVAVWQKDLSKEISATDLRELESYNINLLINNASVFNDESFSETNYSSLRKNFSIHFFSPLFLSKIVKSGNIINFLDSAVTKKRLTHFSYIMSKKMLGIATEDLALELAPKVRVNAVAPGPILPIESKGLKYFEELIEKTPLKLQPGLNEIFETVKFFVRTPSVTGQTLFIDSGQHLL